MYLTCGENIFIAPIQLNWERVIGIYDSEKENFVYGEGAKSPDKPIGHYTQLVWDRSFFLGCAIAYCPSNPPMYIYVCQYCPAGNVNSLNFPYKSGQPCEDCTESCSDNLCMSPCPYTDFFSNCAEFKEKCQDPDIYKHCTATCSCKSEIM
ncbi:cysteine-rich secretory protein-like [Aquarana catesbeiana]|uniref:cysteine-rich secretory protein-like n=1 Tax=Aquarana catesbeiana TaxID=8400 RepID=UPI003CC9CF52